jgi:diguanylate cyclase (GGDEF)-like protein/PAS domain S-box-containing protein
VGILANAFNQMVKDLSSTTVSKAYLDNVLSSMVDPLVVLNFDTTITKVNLATLRLLGYAENELIGRPIDCLYAEYTDLGIRRLVQNGFVGSVELAYVTKDGQQIPMSCSTSLMCDVEGNNQGIVCVARDITEQKRAEAQLRHDALHDALTGLPNRTLFTDRLAHVIELTKRRQDYLFAVLFLDLDRFKMINDSLGHTSGDQLLMAIARRLETCMRSGDTVARLGGDEFTVLLEDVKDIGDVTDIAERIQRSLNSPFNLNGHEMFTTASIGVVLGTTGRDQPEDLLRDADTAMYHHAKVQGPARHEVFHPGMHDRAVAQMQLENDLRRAIERQEFQVYYQPIVSLEETSKINGFEALVRWQHPKRGVISPTEFIPRAEETGLIVPLGYWVLREACQQMRAWQVQFPADPPLTISVNISGKQFSQPNLIEQIKQILQETELDACSLKLEITESTIMENAESATDMLLAMRALGIELAVDDFGTGYSSLGHLNRFPVNTLKIDRSFVVSVDTDVEKMEIIRTVVMLARNLGMNVVAEGVETSKELSQLKALECEGGQGYFFSRPLNSEAAAALLAENSSCEFTVHQ